MARPHRPRSLAFADTVVKCPKCSGQLQYYGKPDWVAVVRDAKPIRLWCPKCDRKFDVNVQAGQTAEEDVRSIVEVTSPNRNEVSR